MIPLKIDSTQIIYFLFKHSNEAHILQLVDILLESFFFFFGLLVILFLALFCHFCCCCGGD